MPEARFVLSKAKVLEQYKKAKELADVVSYSYKTNFEVGQVLTETDCFFSVHSLTSLKLLDVPKRTWFFAQGWDANELKKLLEEGVDKFVVDNEQDLQVLLGVIEKNDKTVDLFLRMKLKEHTIHTGKHYVYGMYSSTINEMLPELRKHKHIGKLGIHFHRKTQNVSEWSLKEELQQSIEDWSNIDMVNIGGGIPAEYKNFNMGVLENIFAKIKDLKKWLNEKNITVIIEPGRFIAASPVKLEADILNIYDNNIVINCSVYNAAMDTFVAHIRLLVEGEGEGEPYTIKGCTPDSMDIFRYKVYLKKPKRGEKIVFLNAGAYNYTTNFCNLPKLETVVVD